MSYLPCSYRRYVYKLKLCIFVYNELKFYFIDAEDCVRKIYRKNTAEDRSRIVAAATRGEDWVTLATTLGINYKTAWNWAKSGRGRHQSKGGTKPKILQQEHIDEILGWIEMNCSITLNGIKSRLQTEYHITISRSAIGNYLEGQMYTTKGIHPEPCTMNSMANKEKRAGFVSALNQFIRAGKQIVYMDETNFNLFCRHTRGRSKVGQRAIHLLPAARGPNIHLVGAISLSGVVSLDQQRGSFKMDTCAAWIRSVLQRWEEQGNRLDDLVLVCDNAPCHSRIESAVADASDGRVQVLRLAPYSPMLNPIEIIWGKIKMYVKGHISNPHTNGPHVVEQRLQYFESLIDDAKGTVTGGDCARAFQHATAFHGSALSLEDMPVGS